MANTEILSKILSNDLCAKWINLRDYAFDKLSSNADIKAIMDEVDKYGYGEWVCEGQVPVMTSNTAPYGEVSASAVGYVGGDAWRAFSGKDNGLGWVPPQQGSNPQWLSYHFINPVCVKKLYLTFKDSSSSNPYLQNSDLKLQASNDGSTWTDVQTILTAPWYTYPDGTDKFFDIENDYSYSYYRIYIATTTNYANGFKLQFYAYQPKGNVPIMTSNTAPYGEAICSSYYKSQDVFNAYRAFHYSPITDISSDYRSWLGSSIGDWCGYKFVNPICVKKLCIANYYGVAGTSYSFKFEASNDGTNWTELLSDSFTGAPDSSPYGVKLVEYFNIDNDDYYLQYRVKMTHQLSNAREGIRFQFYGREMKVSVPTMTSNTQPWGEASAYRDTNSTAYKAFDSTISAAWIGGRANFNNDYVTYDFKKPVLIKKAIHTYKQTSSGALSNFRYKFQASNDGTTWVDLTDEKTDMTSSNPGIWANDFESDTEYEMYRLFVISGNYYDSTDHGFKAQFFGFDYSERDWDTEHPMKYLYDHGVELEEFYKYVNGSSVIDFRSDEIYLNAQNQDGFNTVNKIDLSDYRLIRSVSEIETDTLWCMGYLTGDGNLGVVGFGGYVLSGNMIPRNVALDISAVTDARKIAILNRYNSGVTAKFRWQELWLE